MDFLNKIKNIIRKHPKDSFSDQVRREKEQKYLFREDIGKSFSTVRNKQKTLFGKSSTNKKKEKIPFSGFFQNRFDQIKSDQDMRYVMGAVGGLLLMLSGYIVFFSPYFKISPNHILVEPLTQGVDIAVAYRSLEGIYGQSIFMLDEQSIAQKIQENLQNVANIHIDKLFPNGIKVLIQSLPITFDATIAGVENKSFWLSSNGVLVPVSDLKNATLDRHLEIVDDKLRSEIFLGYKKVITDRDMFLISKTFDIFASEWSDLVIAKAQYFVLENELHVNLESNTKIILTFQDEDLTPSNEVSQLLLNELVTLRTYIANNRNKLIDGSIYYIDARIPWKIFVCTDANRCRQNLIDVYGYVYQQ